MFRYSISAAFGAAAMLMTGSVDAATVTYSYQGNELTDSYGRTHSPLRFGISFDESKTPSGSMRNAEIDIAVIGMEIYLSQRGVLFGGLFNAYDYGLLDIALIAYNSNYGDDQFLSIKTDADRNIVSWNYYPHDTDFSVCHWDSECFFSTSSEQGDSISYLELRTVWNENSYSYDPISYSTEYTASPGQWTATVSAVPLPATIPLLLAAIGGLALVKRGGVRRAA